MLEFHRASHQATAYPKSDAQWNHDLDTVKRIREWPEKRQRDKNKFCNMKTATLNIGSLTGKSREIADMMTRRRSDIMYLQETRWTGVNLVVKQGILEMVSSYTTVVEVYQGMSRDMFKRRMAR